MTHGVVGSDTRPNIEIDLKHIYCDEFGNKHYNMMLTDTSHLSDGNFNLLSLTIMIHGGWTMVGNQEAVAMTKRNKTI